MVSKRTWAVATPIAFFMMFSCLAPPEAEAGSNSSRIPDESQQSQPGDVIDDLDEAARLHLVAIGLQGAGDYRAAEEAFQQALKAAPGRVVTLIGLAKLYIEEGKEDAARATISRAEDEVEDLAFLEKAPHHIVLGLVYLTLDGVDEARRHLDEAEKLVVGVGSEPLMVRVLVGKAKLNSQMQQREAAERLFNEAKLALSSIEDLRVRKPLEYEWLSEFADHNLSIDAYREADRALLALWAHADGNPGVRLSVASRRGEALIGMNRLEEAEDLLVTVTDAYRELLGANHSETLQAGKILDRVRSLKQ